MLHLEVKLTKETIIFLNYAGQEKKLINTILLITTQYIYSSKCRNKELNFLQLMSRIFEMEKVKRIVANHQNHYFSH